MQRQTTDFPMATLLCSRFGAGERRRQSLDCPVGLLGSCWDQSPPWRGRPAGWLGAVLPGPRGTPIDSCHHTRADSWSESTGNMGAFGRGDVLSGLFAPGRRALWPRGPWGQGPYRTADVPLDGDSQAADLCISSSAKRLLTCMVSKRLFLPSTAAAF